MPQAEHALLRLKSPFYNWTTFILHEYYLFPIIFNNIIIKL